MAKRKQALTVTGRSAKSWNSWFGRLSSPQKQFLKTYFFHLVFLFFLANYVVVRQLQLTFFAKSCMSREMVAADNRCLYIYGGEVYEKGTRNKPHKGQKCGTDVTTIIPSFHISNMAKYMDPNLVGTICSGQPPAPTATNTPKPTPSARATGFTQPTMTRTPTQLPAVPTATRVPTQLPAATTTLIPSTPTISPSPTGRSIPTATRIQIRVSAPTPTQKILGQINPTATRVPTMRTQPTNTIFPTVTLEPIMNNQGSGFGRYLADNQLANENGTESSTDQFEVSQPLKPSTVNREPNTNNWLTFLVRISQILVGASFMLVVITSLATLLRKLQQKFSRQ